MVASVPISESSLHVLVHPLVGSDLEHLSWNWSGSHAKCFSGCESMSKLSAGHKTVPTRQPTTLGVWKHEASAMKRNLLSFDAHLLNTNTWQRCSQQGMSQMGVVKLTRPNLKRVPKGAIEEKWIASLRQICRSDVVCQGEEVCWQNTPFRRLNSSILQIVGETRGRKKAHKEYPHKELKGSPAKRFESPNSLCGGGASSTLFSRKRTPTQRIFRVGS